MKFKNILNEIQKISKYDILEYKIENYNDIIFIGLSLKDFPINLNKVTYSIELMNKLDEKLPDNMDIIIV